MIDNTQQKERIILVGIRRPHEAREEMTASLIELGKLVETANGEVVASFHQELKKIDSATLIHKGKVEEIGLRILEGDIDAVILDSELSPAQNRNLSNIWNCKVLDRTALILDIFANRAQTRAGILQVALAQLKYRLPRLAGKGESMMQQAGHIGTRGPGETKLEVDRRRIEENIDRLRGELKELREHRALHRKKRDTSHFPLVSLVGYTNAGKSTLLNLLTEANVLAENKLFATLDPVVRKLKLISGREILLADTVGLIRRLPHSLVEAFHATFEELANADLLCHVIDVSDESWKQHLEIANSVLIELKLNNIPQIIAFNKSDRIAKETIPHLPGKKCITISALNNFGIEELLTTIETELDKKLIKCTLLIPFDRGDLASQLYQRTHILESHHREDGLLITVHLGPELLSQYEPFIIAND